jgi:hypothetical protein
MTRPHIWVVRERRDDPEGLSFESLLAGTVAEAWTRCQPIWRSLGRIEDKPRGVRRMMYQPSAQTLLGRAFAERFHDQCTFIISKLGSKDRVEVACAHDLLVDLTRWESNREAIWAVTRPIMNWVRRELALDPVRYERFRGTTLGELFRYEHEYDSLDEGGSS